MKFSRQDVLDALGIERTPHWLPVAAIGFGVGALLGATMALLLTPKSGRELRGRIAERGRTLIHRGREQAGRMESELQSNLNETPPPTY
jgi:hypothetical protein